MLEHQGNRKAKKRQSDGLPPEGNKVKFFEQLEIPYQSPRTQTHYQSLPVCSRGGE